MIDVNLLRENPAAIKASQQARGASEDLVDQAAKADDNWRKAQAEFENLRAEQNAKAKLVAGASPEVSGFAPPPPEKVVFRLHGVSLLPGLGILCKKDRECGFP